MESSGAVTMPPTIGAAMRCMTSEPVPPPRKPRLLGVQSIDSVPRHCDGIRNFGSTALVGDALDSVALVSTVFATVYFDPAVYGLYAVDQRSQIPFRYYRSGSAFEYDLVRFLFTQKRKLDITKWTFLNTDLAVHVFRVPDGDWIGIRAETSYGPDGIGTTVGTLFDEGGAVGAIQQCVLVRGRPGREAKKT